MRTFSLRALLCAALLLSVNTATDIASVQASEAEVVVTERPVPTDPMPPTMADEIAELIEAEADDLAGLQADLEIALDFEATLEIQKQIQATKIQTEVEVLRVQLRHLSGIGTPVQYVQLETAIESLLQLLPAEDGPQVVDPTLDEANN